MQKTNIHQNNYQGDQKQTGFDYLTNKKEEQSKRNDENQKLD